MGGAAEEVVGAGLGEAEVAIGAAVDFVGVVVVLAVVFPPADGAELEAGALGDGVVGAAGAADGVSLFGGVGVGVRGDPGREGGEAGRVGEVGMVDAGGGGVETGEREGGDEAAGEEGGGILAVEDEPDGEAHGELAGGHDEEDLEPGLIGVDELEKADEIDDEEDKAEAGAGRHGKGEGNADEAEIGEVGLGETGQDLPEHDGHGKQEKGPEDGTGCVNKGSPGVF